MPFFLLPILVLALAFSGRPAEELRKYPAPMTLFDFNTADEASWLVVNDGVMGGRSQGEVLLFTAEALTQA